ncbi:hypothetical protein [Lentzea sp. NBRC 105346]|uniref:hypothetical protein n=1 Tax=Lentzea sp. NBRC 105346 TaxID=3032205 RepID=UPI0025563BBB|nr:hypothetical protein [Lentzea sp. NBRC 105346]
MDPEQYLDALVPLALRLVVAVHDEGPDATTAALTAINALPQPDNGVHPATALIVTLAAMVDPRRSHADLLGWVRKLDPIPPPDYPVGNTLLIELGISGAVPAAALTDDEAAQVAAALVDRGWAENEIRDHMRAEWADIRRWVAAARQRNRRKAAA